MVSADFRKEAREKLSGKWGKAACIALAYTFIAIVLNLIESLFSDTLQALVSLAITIIEVPISLGLIISFVRLYNDEDVKPFDFLTSGFNNFGKSWGIAFQIFLKLILPIILTIVAYLMIAFSILQSTASMLDYSSSSASSTVFLLIGSILLIAASIWNITKSYYYQLTYVIAAENPELSAGEVVEKSEKIMNGKRAKLFWLQLSFIGWAILGIFTLGIGYLWLIPYIQFAVIAFYKFATGDGEVAEVISNDKNNIDE